MYQIFVVEDEVLIRQSIRNTIQQMQGPYSFCGEASDGEMALSMMQELMPDILLTDIRMPFLDGFGLIRHIKAKMPWLKVIIISGYGDFEYAQRAISLGVDQYLLKPVRSADLVKVIETVARQIEQEKKQASLPDGFDEDEVRLALRQHFLRQLLYGGADTGTLLEQAANLQLDLVRSHYQAAVGYLDSPEVDLQRLRRTVQQTLEGAESTLYLFNAPDHLVILSCDNDTEALDERIYQQIGILRHQLQEFCPVSTWVISEEVQRLGAIGEAVKAATHLLKQASAVSAGQVISISDVSQVTADLVSYHGVFEEEFLQKLQYATPGEVPALLDGVMGGPGGRFDSLLMRYNALIELMRLAVQMVSRGLPEAEQRELVAKVSGEVDILSAAARKETFRAAADALLRRALSLRRDGRSELKSPVIVRAEKYVAENFCDPNISLISVARHVGMSPAHFSTVFSQTMGRSFISHLTALRIERAKTLLTTTAMKLSDIAMEIGYNEPNYFSHVFRKVAGVTPKEYRASHPDQ